MKNPDGMGRPSGAQYAQPGTRSPAPNHPAQKKKTTGTCFSPQTLSSPLSKSDLRHRRRLRSPRPSPPPSLPTSLLAAWPASRSSPCRPIVSSPPSQIRKLGVAFEFSRISPASPVSPALDKRGAGSVLAAASLAVEEVQKVRVLRASQMEVVRRFGCAAAAEPDRSPCSPSGAR